MSHFTLNNKFKSKRVRIYHDEPKYGIILQFREKAMRDAKYADLKAKYVRNLSKFSTVVDNKAMWCLTYGG